ncbi:MAG: hypothetical protein V7K47_17955 [Nostoc sp.]
MEKLSRPTFINFSLWACDPDNEGLLEVFYCVCSVINPAIGIICSRFGYAGYLKTVESLILFFADLLDESLEAAQDLIRIFTLLHDAGTAATTLTSSASERFIERLDEVSDFRDITQDFVASCFYCQAHE